MECSSSKGLSPSPGFPEPVSSEGQSNGALAGISGPWRRGSQLSLATRSKSVLSSLAHQILYTSDRKKSNYSPLRAKERSTQYYEALENTNSF